MTLALTGLLGGIVFSTLVVQLRLARVTAVRAAANDAGRAAPSDLHALATDSLALRSFRGLALRCPAAGSLIVRYRGDRLPDVRKDSVLLLTGTAAIAAALTDSRAIIASCVTLPGESLLQWSLETMDDDIIDDVASALVFESGRYFLTSRALRYRLGAEGRQPLTAELFRHPGTSFDTDPGAVRFRLSIDGVTETVLAAPFAPPPHR